MFFGELDKARFDVVCAAAAALVAGSRKAVRYLLAVDEDTRAALRPAG
jgi:hypothetical protein